MTAIKNTDVMERRLFRGAKVSCREYLWAFDKGGPRFVLFPYLEENEFQWIMIDKISSVTILLELVCAL